MNGEPFKVIGLRCSNALVSNASKDQLIQNLPVFKSYGINTVSVYMMGSRFGDVKGYLPNSTLDAAYAARMAQIIEAADANGMVVLVGCLYWGTSEANAALGSWTQTDANAAVANTVQWLKQNNYRNVIVDPDNEGMANSKKGWNISQMIAAAKAVDVNFIVGYNDEAPPPANADILLHFSPRDNIRPYVESEGGADNSGPEYYWGSYSKQNGYDNYIRIGRYTDSMKSHHYSKANSLIDGEAGYIMASTWLQCGPNEGIGGPFMTPGGSAANESNWNQKPLGAVLPNVGISWWLDHIRTRYGAWNPPAVNGGGTGRYKVVQQGGLELALANDDQNNGNANAESNSSADDHLWEKIAAGAEWFRLRNKYSMRYLNVSGGALQETANLAQWGGGSDDHYLFREVADGGFKLLQVKHSLGYIDTIGGSNGTNVQQTFNITNRARWIPEVQGAFVRFVQRDSGLELALASDTQNNGNVNAEVKSVPTDPADHIWRIEDSDEPGWNYLKNEKSGQYLNISGGNLREGANAAQWPGKGGAHYKIRFIPDGAFVRIEFKHSGQYLTTIGESDGTNVQQSSTVNNRARWFLVPIN